MTRRKEKRKKKKKIIQLSHRADDSASEGGCLIGSVGAHLRGLAPSSAKHIKTLNN